MARNGAGVYSLPSGSTATDGQTIQASVHNTPLEDIETDMNTARPVVAGGTGATSALGALKGLGSISGTPIVSGGSANAHTLTTGQSYSTYAEPMSFLVIGGTTNTGAMTVNVDSIGTKNVKMFYNGAIGDPPAGAIVADAPYLWIYDGTNDYFLSVNMTLVSAMLANNLQYLAGLTPAPDKLPFFDSSTSMDLADFSNFAQSLLGNGSASVMRTTLDVYSQAEVVTQITDRVGTTDIYASTGNSYTNGTRITLAHGLSSVPSMFSLVALCGTADAGFSAGDKVVPPSFWNSSANYYGTSISADATNIYIDIGVTGIRVHTSAGALGAIWTPANWTLEVRAWAF